MAYDTYLSERIDQVLISKNVDFLTKKMMGGLCYMVDDKMLCGILKNQLMARIGLVGYEEALTKSGVHQMTLTGRSMKAYVFIDMDAIDTDEDLEYWLQLCLDYNPLARSSKKKN